MRITTITASASRTFNHPHERFANFRHEFTATGQLEHGDVPAVMEKELRRQVEEITENHKRDILHDIELEHQREGLLRTLSDIERGWCGTPKEEIEAQIAALPKPRLLPEVIATEKEIHPGHADHPATDADDND